MFQQTIQDLLAVAEAGPRADDLLERVRATIVAFERFESGELLAQTQHGLSRFVLARGLGEASPKALAALGKEPTLRVDTNAELQSLGLTEGPGLASLLILRLEMPGVTSAAIVLGHTRPWSFAAAPLSRIRTIGSVALRLLAAGPGPDPTSEEVATLRAEVNRLRTHVASLESETAGLRASLPRPRSGKPQ